VANYHHATQGQNVAGCGPKLMLSLDVVVRTLADSQRSGALFRALDSIQSQCAVSARPIVVVNGDRYDPQVTDAAFAETVTLFRRAL